jgi:hypothetical protein
MMGCMGTQKPGIIWFPDFSRKAATGNSLGRKPQERCHENDLRAAKRRQASTLIFPSDTCCRFAGASFSIRAQ